MTLQNDKNVLEARIKQILIEDKHDQWMSERKSNFIPLLIAATAGIVSLIIALTEINSAETIATAKITSANTIAAAEIKSSQNIAKAEYYSTDEKYKSDKIISQANLIHVFLDDLNKKSSPEKLKLIAATLEMTITEIDIVPILKTFITSIETSNEITDKDYWHGDLKVELVSKYYSAGELGTYKVCWDSNRGIDMILKDANGDIKDRQKVRSSKTCETLTDVTSIEITPSHLKDPLPWITGDIIKIN